MMTKAKLDTVSEGCGGFKVIKWKTSEESSTTHDFFIKAHDIPSGQSSKKPLGRTLLVLNVPPFLNRGNVRHIFHPFGKIVDVFIQQKPTGAIPNYPDPLFPQEKDSIRGYKVAYVVFQNPKSMKEILSVDTDEIQHLIMGKTRCGLNGWIDSYNSQIVETHILEDNVKKFMVSFEKQEVLRKEAEKQAGEADNDGWVTVTKKGKRSLAGTARTETAQEKLKAKKRRMEKAVLNLTPTQIKETKARQLEELKKKFEEDKQKVALLKQQRKFRPF